jgi:hypothetical protein
MPKGVLLVMSQSVPGKEEEYNDWYINVHIPELLEVPGIAAAQRFEAVDAPNSQTPPQKYLAIYEFDTDPEEAMKAMREARSRPGVAPPSPALDRSSSVMYVYRAFSDREEA